MCQSCSFGLETGTMSTILCAHFLQPGFPVDTHVANVIHEVMEYWMPQLTKPDLVESNSEKWKNTVEKSTKGRVLHAKVGVPLRQILSVRELKDLHMLLR